jgi:uncharacterized protein (TIGR04168 family)
MIKIAIIGDNHRHFTLADVATLNHSDYDLVLITGDLVDFRAHDAFPIADLLAQLKMPALLIPGNHDCTNITQFLAEVKGINWLAEVSSGGQEKRVAELRRHLGPVTLAAYSCHDFSLEDQDFSVIAARPFSPGGPELRFRPYLRQEYGINSLGDSVQRLQKLVDEAASESLIFLAHNGPTGLGSEKDDIWGCDFRAAGGDYGDPDLQEAILYAKQRGKQVSAVVAGHMHHQLQDGAQRRWLVEADGTTYINAARVPRIFESDGNTLHHHLAVTLEGQKVVVTEMLLS